MSYKDTTKNSRSSFSCSHYIFICEYLHTASSQISARASYDVYRKQAFIEERRLFKNVLKFICINKKVTIDFILMSRLECTYKICK